MNEKERRNKRWTKFELHQTPYLFLPPVQQRSPSEFPSRETLSLPSKLIISLIWLFSSFPSASRILPFESSSRPVSSPPPEGVRSLWSGNYQPARWSLEYPEMSFSFQSIEFSFDRSLVSLSAIYYCYSARVDIIFSFFFPPKRFDLNTGREREARLV